MVLVVGAGLLRFVAVRAGQVLKLTMQDACSLGPALGHPQQIVLDFWPVCFLLTLGVGFYHTEGCRCIGHFFTLVGFFQGHLLSLLESKGQRPGFCLVQGTKVRRGLGK